MKKRALSIILSFSMMLSLMPTTAFAEDDGNLNAAVGIQNVDADEMLPGESEAAEDSSFTEDMEAEEEILGEGPSVETENTEPLAEETAVGALDLVAEDIAINEENFPDENFRSYVMEYDQNYDGVLSESERASVTAVYFNYDKDIKNVKGIEFFTELETLDCTWSNIEEIDLSQNAKLRTLTCTNASSLRVLKLGDNPKLIEIDCSGTALNSLDVSGNPALETLNCSCTINALGRLDLRNNTELKYLDCYCSGLTVLDISNNTELKGLKCGGNRLTSLDLTNNTQLEEIVLWMNMYAYDITISQDNRAFDLSTLPGKFDVNRASNWEGGIVNGNILTVSDDTDLVKYKYDCGHGITETFYLDIQFVDTLIDAVLSFDANGGTQAPESIKAEADGSVTISNIIPVRDGYRFCGWALTADAVTVNYIEGESITIEKDTTLYAVWEVRIGGSCGENLEWDFKYSSLIISGSGDMDNYTSKSEMPWYDYRDQIQEIAVTSDVTSIGDYAFYGMPELKKITIADSVETIGEYAFKNCTSLWRVNMPESMKRIGQSAFYGCSALTSIEIPEGVYTVWGYTFKNCTSLTTVSLPLTLIKLDEAAFYGCSDLESITIPDNVSIIGVYCFKNCSSLNTVELPNSLREVREASFYGTALDVLTIPHSVTRIGAYAFKNCVALKSVNMPANLEKIDESAFYGCEAIAELALTGKLTSIGSYAFRKCTGLKSVSFPEGLQSIGEAAFYGCTGLSELTIPEGVTEIGAYAFKTCASVSTVSLPATLEEMGDSAFYGCSQLTQIVIPENVTSIGAYAFSRCSALGKITFAGSAPSIGAYAFNGVKANIYYPAGDATWSTDKQQSYGGQLTWEAN